MPHSHNPTTCVKSIDNFDSHSTSLLNVTTKIENIYKQHTNNQSSTNMNGYSLMPTHEFNAK